jgi:hypothetical protein
MQALNNSMGRLFLMEEMMPVPVVMEQILWVEIAEYPVMALVAMSTIPIRMDSQKSHP